MTRRIAITILLTVWTAILVAGLTAWLTARAVLLNRLDATILHRALVVASQSGVGATEVPTLEGDRYVIKGPRGRTVLRQPTAALPAMQPQLIDASFVTLPEGRFRSLTLRVTPTDQQPLTLVYSTPAAAYDQVLARLAMALGVCGALAGALASMLSAWLARVSLRPLNRACQALSSVNEANLDARMDADSMPAELRPIAGQFNEMIARLQGAFEQRRRFLADASHELRTPVAALITTMEVALRRPRPAQELIDALDICLSEARHMQALIQALLAQVKAQGKIEEQTQRIDVAQAVNRCAVLGRSLGADRGITVSSMAQDNLAIEADPDRLRSVLLNLVGNAIDYHREGGRVDLQVIGDGQWIDIFVKDNGPGIAAEHLPYLFQPFYRSSRNGDSNGHLGLGLFLVESHVKAMGGQCRVESAMGVGTTFQIRLPAVAEGENESR
jgi:signal transduction histidine kinase